MPIISELYIYFSGNASLVGLPSEELKRRYICENHFTNDSFINKTLRNRLIVSAVPESYLDLEQPEEDISVKRKRKDDESLPGPSNVKKVYRGAVKQKHETYLKDEEEVQIFETDEERRWLQDITNLPTQSPSASVPERNSSPSVQEKKLLRRIQSQKKVISTKRKQVTRLRNKVSFSVEQLGKFTFKTPTSKVLVEMQLGPKQRRLWPIDQKKFALALYYKSPSAYKFLYNKIVLPSPKTVQRWIGKSNFLPGFSTKLFWQIEQKVKTWSESEKACVICFDEMSLKETMEYNKSLDFIEGFEDLGHLGRTHRKARYALVFLARGLYSRWKLSLAYFVSHCGVPTQHLVVLLKTVLEKCFQSGLLPQAVVCDQGTSNQSTYKKLGVLENQPFFKVGTHQIIALYDVPHLFKNFRNNLLQNNFINNDQEISFQDVRAAYNIDQSKTCKAMTKITERHINPKGFQKMSVKLATQIFSHTVASCIKTCVATGELRSATALNTADFISRLNNTFDALNSSSFHDANPYKCSLHYKHTRVMSTLKESLNYFSSLKKGNVKKTFSRPPCFTGLLQTIRGVLLLYNNEAERKSDAYILTRKLNQDIIENLFSIFRQKGGYNPNPTVRTFRTTFRSFAINALLTPAETGNCEHSVEDGEEIGIESLGEISSTSIVTEEPYLTSSTASSSEVDTTPIAKKAIALEECSIRYFAGYLARVVYKKTKCDTCHHLLTNKDSTLSSKEELFILNKLYGSSEIDTAALLAPSDLLCEAVTLALDLFKKYFDKLKHKRNLKKRIMNKIITKLETTFLTGDCKEHKILLLEHCIICVIFKTCNFASTKYVPAKENVKLKKVQHL